MIELDMMTKEQVKRWCQFIFSMECSALVYLRLKNSPIKDNMFYFHSDEVEKYIETGILPLVDLGGNEIFFDEKNNFMSMSEPSDYYHSTVEKHNEITH